VLCSVADAKERIRGLTTSAEDGRLTTLCQAASTAIARLCGYPGQSPSMEATTYTAYLSGPSDADGRVIRLPVRPVVSVTSVYDDPDWEWGSSTLVASTDYAVDTGDGTITLGPDGGTWSREPRAIKVTYVAGFSVVPYDLKLAAAVLVHHWWTQLDTQGGPAADSGPPEERGIPASVRARLSLFILADRWL